ncbi:MAG: hypothetical protein AAF581_20840 [Planctomycetota bacterium]
MQGFASPCVLRRMSHLIATKFESIGARVDVHSTVQRRWGQPKSPLRIDIARDRRGEFFDIGRRPDEVQLRVLDTRPHARHLLLFAQLERGNQRFLCGFDEREWFVAGIPDRARVSTVAAAMEALRPDEVSQELLRKGVKKRRRNRRRNAAFVRQGEWFFIPAPDLRPNEQWLLRREPLQRGGGKPHIVDELYRSGGETVYVSRLYPNGLVERDYRAWLSRYNGPRVAWQVMRRDAAVYVRGRVRHPDHKTIRLRDWHQVQMNLEWQSTAMRNVAFLD